MSNRENVQAELVLTINTQLDGPWHQLKCERTVHIPEPGGLVDSYVINGRRHTAKAVSWSVDSHRYVVQLEEVSMPRDEFEDWRDSPASRNWHPDTVEFGSRAAAGEHVKANDLSNTHCIAEFPQTFVVFDKLWLPLLRDRWKDMRVLRVLD